jgi:hypothetical protein
MIETCISKDLQYSRRKRWMAFERCRTKRVGTCTSHHQRDIAAAPLKKLRELRGCRRRRALSRQGQAPPDEDGSTGINGDEQRKPSLQEVAKEWAMQVARGTGGTGGGGCQSKRTFPFPNVHVLASFDSLVGMVDSRSSSVSELSPGDVM